MTEACEIGARPPEPDYNPSATDITRILRDSTTIAIIGLSDKPHRESFIVGKYLFDHGYKVIPVNPALTERGWLGIKAYPDLGSIPGEVDIIDVFRRSEAIPELVPSIIAKKPKTVWLQLGIVNNDAARMLRDEGITVVQNKCVKIEHSLLIGE